MNNKLGFNGVVLYEGPSAIDGSKIVLIATGFDKPSKNSKTGPMVQTWILRVDVSPMEAQKQNLDVSVCGGCKLKPYWQRLKLIRAILGLKRCYVDTSKAPNSVYNAYCAGLYPHISELDEMELETVQTITGQNKLRIGSYGDGMAIPYDRLMGAIKLLGYPKTTGYTHQWRMKGSHKFANVLMASCETEKDAKRARAIGFNIAYVDPKKSTCPAQNSDTVTCQTCLKCNGTSGDVVFSTH